VYPVGGEDLVIACRQGVDQAGLHRDSTIAAAAESDRDVSRARIGGMSPYPLMTEKHDD
jgi:hypothetical protein